MRTINDHYWRDFLIKILLYCHIFVNCVFNFLSNNFARRFRLTL